MESKLPRGKHPRIHHIADLISIAHVMPLCYISCFLQTAALLLFVLCLTLTGLVLFEVISSTSFLKIHLLGCNETCTRSSDVTPQPPSAGPGGGVSPFLSLSNHNSKRQAETDSSVPGAHHPPLPPHYPPSPLHYPPLPPIRELRARDIESHQVYLTYQLYRVYYHLNMAS